MSDLPELEARVYVSWDGSGAFTGPYDDVTPDVAGEPGLVVTEGRDAAQTLAPPRVASGTFELFNHDGTYSQHRADSPVYQRVLPGRPVGYRLSAGTATPYDEARPYDEADPYDGRGTWEAGRHVIDDISQQTGWGQQRVGLGTIGTEVVLIDSRITVPLQLGLRTDQCVQLILDACGWPASRRIIGLSDTTLIAWWCDEQQPWAALLELLGAEGPGTFYVDRYDNFHWEGRNFRTITTRANTSQATFSDRSGGGGLWFRQIGYDPNYQSISNRATFSTRRRQAQAITKVWEYGATLTLTAGESRTLIARPSDPFVNADLIREGTDYAVVPPLGATVTISATSGFVMFIEVTAGPSGASITGITSNGIQLRAQPLTVVSETIVENSINADASIATYSPIVGAAIPIPYVVNGWPELEPAQAEAVCNAWVSRYREPRALVTIVIEAVDAAHAYQILTRLPSDRITLVEANTGLADDAWINSMELRISGAGGRSATLVLGCELCDTLAGAVWNTSVWDAPGSVWGT